MTASVTLIVAMTRDRVIGANGALPWRLPADLRHFREVTMGKPILMGRKTHESIGRPLPGRQNIVVSGNPGFRAEGCEVAYSVEEALRLAGDAEVMVIGGAEIFAATLPLARHIWLTEVHADIPGDTYFPDFSRADWREVYRRECASDEANPHPYSFVLLRRSG
jgi:dihydrofolate reductase